MRVLVPYAAWLPGAAQGLDLAPLLTWLQGQTVQHQLLPSVVADYALPHEHLLAGGSSQALPPSAVLQRQAALLHPQPAELWANISLCHWQIGMNGGQLRHPAQLQIQQAEAEILWQALAPSLAEHDVTLAPYPVLPPYQRHVRLGPTWQGADDLIWPSLARVAGQELRPWLEPEGTATALRLHKRWQALLAELQMLLYQMPLNAQRERQRQSGINSLWLHGVGYLPPPDPSPWQLWPNFAQAAEAADLAAWRAAWQSLLTEALPAWQQASRQSQHFELVLAGTSSYLHIRPAQGLAQKLAQPWRKSRTRARCLAFLQPDMPAATL